MYFVYSSARPWTICSKPRGTGTLSKTLKSMGSLKTSQKRPTLAAVATLGLKMGDTKKRFQRCLAKLRFWYKCQVWWFFGDTGHTGHTGHTSFWTNTPRPRTRKTFVQVALSGRKALFASSGTDLSLATSEYQIKPINWGWQWLHGWCLTQMHYVEGKFWGGSTFRPIPEPNQSNMFEKKSTAVPESHTSMQSTISGSCNRAYFSIRVFHAFLRQMLDKFWVWSTLNCKRSDNMLFSTSQPQTSPNMDLSVQGVVELACIIFLLISSRTSWGEVRLVGPRMPRSHLDALRGDLKHHLHLVSGNNPRQTGTMLKSDISASPW